MAFAFGFPALLTSASSSPSGAAGGDLTGTYPNPTIAALAVTNAKMAAGAAAANLGFTPASLSGNNTFSGTQTFSGNTYPNTTANLIAAGTTQGTATPITNDVSIVTGTNLKGLILPTPVRIGQTFTLFVAVANSISLYPQSGGTVNGQAADAAMLLYTFNSAIYKKYVATAVSSTAWQVVAELAYDSANELEFPYGTVIFPQNVTANGTVTANGLLSIKAQTSVNVSNVTAAGSDQGSATVLDGTHLAYTITSGSNGTGVQLPSAVTGAVFIINDAVNASHTIYPASGEFINNKNVNVGVTIVGIGAKASVSYKFIATATGQWVCSPGIGTGTTYPYTFPSLVEFTNAVLFDSSATFSLGIIDTVNVLPKTTTPQNLFAAIASATFTNVGAGATQIIFTLPAATTVGQHFEFVSEDSGGIQVVAHGTDVFHTVTTSTGAALASAAGGTITTTVAGAVTSVMCYKSGFWCLRNTVGTIGAAATTWVVA